MIILKKRQLIIAALSGLFLLVIGHPVGANSKLNNRQQVVTNIVFKPTSETQLEQYVYETVDPHSVNYHHYLTTNEFAKKFGQSDQYVASFKRYLSSYHVRSLAYHGNLSLTVRGSRANVNRAFHARYDKRKDQKARTTYRLPHHLAKQIVAVIGLRVLKSTNHSKRKHLSQASSVPINKHRILNSNDSHQLNTNLTGRAFSKKFGALKFANHYQLSDLYQKGLVGQKQRIGIIAFGDFHLRDIQTYWRQNGINDATSRIHKIYTVDNQKQVEQSMTIDHIQEQSEATLDVESAGAVAPQATIDFYTGTSVNQTTDLETTLFVSFAQAISDNVDKQLSTSFSPHVEKASEWSDRSTTLSQYNHAFNLIFEQAAVQGITVFSASGDRGPWNDGGLKEVQSISTSPYQVIVGGTTLPYTQVIHDKVIQIVKERAWGDGYTIDAASFRDGAFSGGGGGFSAINSTPRYQQGVSGINTFRAVQLFRYLPNKDKYILNLHPKVITGVGKGRNLPDVAGNADSRTGYATYLTYPQLVVKHGKKQIIFKKYWVVGGGTSYTSPQMAAANAVMNSGRTTPIGFWNPQIYQFAQQSDSPFNVLDDATNNNNLYYTGQPGKLYNQATGLGTINFAKLYHDFEHSPDD